MLSSQVGLAKNSSSVSVAPVHILQLQGLCLAVSVVMEILLVCVSETLKQMLIFS